MHGTQCLLLNQQLKQYQFQFKMDYEALANILPKPTKTWSQYQVSKWLQFVHLQTLSSTFATHHVNGQNLLNLNLSHLQALGISNSIIQRKLLRWIKEGFSEFEDHLKSYETENKENIPPLQRKNTTERQSLKAKQQKTSFVPQEDESMIVRSCDGNLAAFYVMKEKSLKIGRSSVNTIRSLEVSVENEHAEIFRIKKKYFLRDNGTEAGTFIKIIHPKILSEHTLVEMGSFLIEAIKVDKESKMLTLGITHMVSKGTCELIIGLQDGCSFYSFGRRKSNNFCFDDEHLSGMHARIFILHGEFVIQDLHSTNGTWLRLSKPFESSNSFLLQEGCTFKIGTTITYQCEGNKSSEQKMQIEYDDNCISCGKQKKNILLLPCRHNIVCSGCADISQCLMCHSVIQQKIKIYI